MTDSIKTTITQTAKELFDVLGIKEPFTVENTEEGSEIILDTQEGGILIGYHGETLEALQLILSLCVSRKLGSFHRISVEIGGYKKNRIDFLKDLVEKTKQKVMEDKQEHTLSNLKSWERRIVHTILSEDPDVMSESIGEGRERTLTIHPR